MRGLVRMNVVVDTEDAGTAVDPDFMRRLDLSVIIARLSERQN
jgi:hypothetical protein